MPRKLRGYTRVQPTRLEIEQWGRKNPTTPHNFPYRVECDRCSKRLWVSGLGIGSHERFHNRERDRQFAEAAATYGPGNPNI